MSLLIKRNKANIFRIGTVKIYPGITELTDEADIQVLTSHPSHQAMLNNGVHQIITKESVKKKEEETADIASMKAKDAIDIISETYSIPILEDMYQREMDDKGRTSVIKAIEDQIEEMRTPDEKPEDDDEEDDE